MQAEKLREKIIERNNNRLMVQSVDFDLENLQVIGDKIIIPDYGSAPITRPTIKWEFPCKPVGAAIDPADDPGLYRRLTLKFPFDGVIGFSRPSPICSFNEITSFL